MQIVCMLYANSLFLLTILFSFFFFWFQEIPAKTTPLGIITEFCISTHLPSGTEFSASACFNQMKKQCDTSNVTFFLLVPLLETSCHFCLWQLQAVHALALNDCQSVLSGLCKKFKSIKQGGIVPRIIVKTSCTLPHGSAKSMPFPLARQWRNLYTHNLKLHSSWLSYQMGWLDQIKRIVFLLTLHHRFLLKSYTEL